jgi:cytochrome c556
LRALASAQAPLFAALEERAEDIRRKLAPLGDPDRLPEMPAIPADFEARITAYHSEKDALQKELLARVDEVKKSRGSADSAAASDSVRQAIADFTNENAARYADLAKMRVSIRTDLSKMEAGSSAPVSPDAMVAQFSDSLKKLQSYWNDRDYRNAMLQPGLSPEQRRLLFDGALQKLALPLPRGELLFEPGP